MSGSDAFPRGKTAIVGAATFGIGEAPGYEAIELAAIAAQRAITDAGLQLKDVDALFVGLPQDYLSGLTLAEYLGLRPKITDNNRTGGSAFLAHVAHAALALDAGACDVAVIAYGSNQRSMAGGLVSALGPSPVEAPYKPRFPMAAYGLAAARHAHLYGTTAEQLAHVAVSARQWAKLNPEAFKRGDLSVADCLATRMIADPLRVSDCCLVTDGAAAIVMTRAPEAKNLRRQPIYVLGSAAATTHREIAQMPDLTVTGAAESGARAYAQAGLGPADVDVVQLYDAFTINTILFLEDLGFCKKGEGGAFVADGNIAPGGSLPVNTNGGGLSCVHPGMYGLFTLVEATQQLRRDTGERQVQDAHVAVCHGNGGVLSSQATTILGTADVL